MAAEPAEGVESKMAAHPTPPVDAIVIINPKMAIMSLVWDNLDEPDSPSSLDSSSPRTYVSETSSSNGLGEMMHHTLPSTPVNYGPSTTPVRTPSKAPSREQGMAVMSLVLENLEVPEQPRSLDAEDLRHRDLRFKRPRRDDAAHRAHGAQHPRELRHECDACTNAST